MVAQIYLEAISGCPNLAARIHNVLKEWAHCRPKSVRLESQKMGKDLQLHVREGGGSLCDRINVIQYLALLPWNPERAQIAHYLIAQEKWQAISSLNTYLGDDLKNSYAYLPELDPLVACALFNDSSMISYLITAFPQLNHRELKIFAESESTDVFYIKHDYIGNILHAIIHGKTSRESKQQNIEKILQSYLTLLQIPDVRGFSPYYYLAAFNILNLSLVDYLNL